MKTEDLRERLAEAIYGEGDAPAWLTTTDGSPNTASFEYAQRLVNALARAGFDIVPRADIREEFAIRWGDEPEDQKLRPTTDRGYVERKVSAALGDRILRRTRFAYADRVTDWEEVQ